MFLECFNRYLSNDFRILFSLDNFQIFLRIFCLKFTLFRNRVFLIFSKCFVCRCLVGLFLHQFLMRFKFSEFFSFPHLFYTASSGAYPGGAQGARAPPPPLISRVVIFQPIIVYTINPPVSDMLVPAPSTPKYIPLPI